MNYFDQTGRDVWTLTCLAYGWIALALLHLVSVPVQYALALLFPAPGHPAGRNTTGKET